MNYLWNEPKGNMILFILKNSPHWSERTEIHTDLTQLPFWPLAPRTADDGDSLLENSGRAEKSVR